VLSLAAGALGAVLARWAAAALDRAVSHSMLPRMTAFRVDGAVLAFTAALSVVACLLSSLWPAIRSSRFELNSRGSGRLLIACEAALATVLLIATASAAGSTLRMLAMERGIDPRNVLTAQLWMPLARYPSAAVEGSFVERLLERVRALDGVESASVVSYPPLGLLGTAVPIEIEGRPPAEPGQPPATRFRVIGTDFFHTLRLPLVAGRDFTEHDAGEANGVAIVSETFARRFFPAGDAIGKRVRPLFPGGGAFWYPESANVPLRIVGVARDIREDGIDVGPLPQMYIPNRQNPSRILHLLVRTHGEPSSWAPAVAAVLRDIDPYGPLFDVKPYTGILRETFARQRAFGALLGGAAVLALLLAAAGIYAQTAWTVSRRTREIGIRVAIGATPRDVVRFALWHALAPAIAGVAVGIAGALALRGTVLSADLTALALGPAVLLLAALVATLVPVRTALRVSPSTALRTL
jgi:putative ABC transport system permease protein